MNKNEDAGIVSFVYKVALMSIMVANLSASHAFADGLAGEYLLSDQWKIFNRYNSPSSNPALLMERMYTQLRGTGAVSVDGVAKLWDLGLTIPLGLYNTIGFTVTGEIGRQVSDYGEEILMGQPSTETHYSSNNNLFCMVSYAINPVGKLSLGANCNVAVQSNFGEPGLGVGADFGMSYRLLLHSLLGFHIIGVTLNNVVPLDVGLKEPNPYSSKIRGMYHGEFFRIIDIDFQYDIFDLFPEKSLFDEKIVRKSVFSVQGTLNLIPFIAFKGFCDIDRDAGITVGGFGCELNVPIVNNGRDAVVCYQYSMNSDKKLDGDHSFYYSIDVGLHREEMYARKMGQLVDINANELYNRAMGLFYEGKYWDAFFIYARILVEFPDFFKNDLVTYLSGSCLEEMDMREEALKSYEVCVSSFPKSVAASWANLGAMRVFYKQNNFDAAVAKGEKIFVDGISDSIKQHAYYLLGEIEIATGKTEEAIAHLLNVSEEHPDFIFSRFSLSTLYAKIGKNELCFKALEECINTKITTAAQKELFNRSILNMGFIFYEENSLSKAIVAFRMIPDTSRYYKDALLGAGWSAIRASQWNDCITTGRMLKEASGKIILQCEGIVMTSFGHVMLKQFDEALALLNEGVHLCEAYSGFDSDSLHRVKLEYESERLRYDLFGEQVIQLSGWGKNVKKYDYDRMRLEQVELQKKMVDYLKGFDEGRRTLFFERNLKTVKEDIEYMFAVVQKIKNSTASKKESDKLLEKQNEITQEIEKLESEMEKFGK